MTSREACITQLYNNLPDKSKVHTNKRLQRIEHTVDTVRVHLADGSVEEGDMVIGADGVHSVVRLQMWEYASKHAPTTIPESDKAALFSEYCALICSCAQQERFGLAPAENDIVFGQDATKMLFTQAGKVYGVVVFKRGHIQSPRKRISSDEDANAVAERFADLPLTEKIKWGDLWEARTSHALLVRGHNCIDTPGSMSDADNSGRRRRHFREVACWENRASW